MNCKYVFDVSFDSLFLLLLPPLTSPLYSHAQPFNYCGQLNALEAFAWIEWCAVFSLACLVECVLIALRYRILTTFALIVLLIRSISSGRHGDGMRGGVVA